MKNIIFILTLAFCSISANNLDSAKKQSAVEEEDFVGANYQVCRTKANGTTFCWNVHPDTGKPTR